MKKNNIEERLNRSLKQMQPPEDYDPKKFVQHVCGKSMIETMLKQNCNIHGFELKRTITHYVDHSKDTTTNQYIGRFLCKDGNTLLTNVSKKDFDIFHPFRKRYTANAFLETGKFSTLKPVPVKSASDLYFLLTELIELENINYL